MGRESDDTQRQKPGFRPYAVALYVAYLTGLGVFAYFASVVGVFPGEVSASAWVQSFRSPWLDAAMQAISFTDKTLVLLVFPFVVAALIYLRGWQPESTFMALTSAAGIAIMTGLKEIIARPRPSGDMVQIITEVDGYSFPSGNVMLYVVYLGAVAFIFAVRLPSGVSLRLALGGFAVILLAIGYSRIYLGAHWLGDVVGGYAFGAGVAVASAWIWRYWSARRTETRQHQ